MAGEEELLALAQLAGQTVVAAAATDVWNKAKQGFARLLGRGDPGRAQAAERRLENTHRQLAEVSGPELEAARIALAGAWQTRLADVLEDAPGVAADLRMLVTQIRVALPAGMVSAADHGAAAGGDMNISASGGSVAAGVIHGNVMPGKPTGPGLAGS